MKASLLANDAQAAPAGDAMPLAAAQAVQGRAGAGHPATVVAAVAVSPSGRHAITAAWDHTARLWDLGAGQLAQPAAQLGQPARQGLAAVLARACCCAGGGGGAGHTDRVLGAAFAPSGAWVATCGKDRTVRLWDMQEAGGGGSPLRELRGHTDWVVAVAASPDSQRLVTASEDNTVRVWNAGTGNIERVLQGHSMACTSVAVSPDGRTIASGANGGELRLWDLATGECRHVVQTREGAGAGYAVKSVAFAPDGSYVVCGSYKRVSAWDPASGEGLFAVDDFADWVNAVAVDPQGRAIAAGIQGPMEANAAYSAHIRLIDPATQQTLHTLEGHARCVTSLAWAPSGAALVSGSRDGTFRVWTSS